MKQYFNAPVFLAVCISLGISPPAARPNTITVTGNDSAAITAAIARSAPGDTVRLLAGTYRITAPITPKSGTHLVGAGKDRTVLTVSGSTSTIDLPALMDLQGREDVEVASLTLDGASNPGVHQGIFGSDARRLRLHDLAIRNLVKGSGFGPHGIYFTGSNPTGEKGVTDSEIADCTLDNIGIGAEYGGGIRLAWGSSRNRILRNTIRNTGRGGIFGNNGSTDSTVRNNVVTGSQGEGLGIEMWNGCRRAIIEDNRVDHWISLDGSSDSAVRRNTISDRSGSYKLAGLEIVGSSFCVFTDNVVDEGQQIGISVSNAPLKNYLYFANNTIRRCNQWGAQIQGESGGAGYYYFYRCTFAETPLARGKVMYPGDEGHGFRTNGNAHHLTFDRCAFQNNGRLGLQLGGTDVDFLRFDHCTISGNRGAAVSGLQNYTALEWLGCAVKDNGNNTLPTAKPFMGSLPIVSFTLPTTARVGEAVRFSSTSRPAGQSLLTHYLWDFNDGVPSKEKEAAHTYTRPGNYRVTLLVWDDNGRAARAEHTLTVRSG